MRDGKAVPKIDNTNVIIVNPVFNDVTIDATAPIGFTPDGGYVTFVGTYNPLNITAVNNEMLYLGAANMLYWPNAEMTINAFRAYFQISTNLGDVNGDRTVSVTDVTLVVNHILSVSNDNFIIEKADINGDGTISVSDVMALVNIILNGDNGTQNVVINSADGFTLGSSGNEPARTRHK